MSCDIRSLAAAYIATLRPREVGLACSHHPDCDAEVIGVVVPSYEGVTTAVCANHAAYYVDVVNLPPSVVALRALVSRLNDVTPDPGNLVLTPSGDTGRVIAVENHPKLGERVWVLPLRDENTDHPGAWYRATELTPVETMK